MITRLDKELCTPSPTGLLIMGNLRQCSGEWAPAIASALGVTVWYSSELKQKSKKPQPLMLETYPLAFVQEAARKLCELSLALLLIKDKLAYIELIMYLYL